MPAHTLGGVLYLEEGRGRRMVVRGKQRMGRGRRREKSRVSYKWVYFYMKNVSLNFLKHLQCVYMHSISSFQLYSSTDTVIL